MSATFKRISNRSEWLNRAASASAQLRDLSMGEFYNPTTDRYHPVREEIATLVWSLKTDVTAFETFLDTHPQPHRWLPDAVEDLENMSSIEIKFRTGCNIADERWGPVLLVEPFRSGILKAALDRLIADFEQMVIDSD